MKQLMITKTLALAIIAVAAFAARADAERENPLDDSLFYALGLRGDLNGNGAIDADEITNAMDPSTSKSVTFANGPYTEDPDVYSPFSWVTASWQTGAEAAMKWPHSGDAIRSPQHVKIDADGDLCYWTTRILHSIAVAPGSEQTVFLRFRWDGFDALELEGGRMAEHVSSVAQTVFAFGWSYSNNRGWSIAASVNPTKNTGTMTFYCGNKSVSPGAVTITPGAWQDMFFTIRDNGDSTVSVVQYAFNPSNTSRPTETVRSATLANSLVFEEGNVTLQYAGQSSGTGWTKLKNSTNNATKSFRGTIRDVRIWSRALSDLERRQVVAGYYGAKWRMGAANGSAAEFAADGGADEPAASYDPETMPWLKMRGALTAQHPSLTVCGAWTKQDRAEALPRVLSVTPIFEGVGGDPCPVEVRVNGALAASGNLTDPFGRNLLIPASFWQPDADGNVALTVTRTGALAGTVLIDAMELGGSWQGGYKDGSVMDMSKNDISHCCYFAGDPVASNMNRTVRNSQVVDLRVHLPEWLATRHAFKYETRIVNSAGNAGFDWHEQTVVLLVNGQHLWSTNYVDNNSKAFIKLDVPNAMLVPGINVFRWTNITENAEIRSNCWVCFDYQCLRIGRLRVGSSVIIR